MGVEPPTATIDATGKYVVPGGVDVHTHMELPFGGTDGVRHVRDRHAAPRHGAASPRSSTSPCRRTGENVHDGLADVARARPTGNCAIDYGFHQIIGGVDDESLKAMTYLVDNEGITSFKLFMAYPGVFYTDDGQILRAMQNARRERGDDHDARRERHRHRRARRAGARPRRDRPEVPLAHPARRARGRGHAPGDPARQGRRQRAALHRAHVGRRGARGGRRGPARRPQRVRRDLPAVPLPDARGPRSRSPASRAPSGSAPRRCAPSTSTTRPTCGRVCG